MSVCIGQDLCSALTNVSDPECAATALNPFREDLAFKEPLARAGGLFQNNFTVDDSWIWSSKVPV